jgi:hypothetical protein
MVAATAGGGTYRFVHLHAQSFYLLRLSTWTGLCA